MHRALQQESKLDSNIHNAFPSSCAERTSIHSDHPCQTGPSQQDAIRNDTTMGRSDSGPAARFGGEELEAGD